MLKLSRQPGGQPEIFHSLQGEGATIGVATVFLRLSLCNLSCSWCDTKYTWDWENYDYKKEVIALDTEQVREKILSYECPHLVVTGGEPLLQLDEDLIDAFHGGGFEVAVETNGTLSASPGLDWICVSPKAGTELTLLRGDELKLVYPQQGATPEMYENLDFRHFLRQPMDGEAVEENTRLVVEYCLAHPGWRLSLQTHKFLGIP